MRKMSPDLEKALAKPVDLEWLAGIHERPIVEDRLKSNVSQILSWRRYPDDYEAHFTMFNALSLIQAFQPKPELMDWIDAKLSDYILTCKSDTEAQANLMLCDLIIDHWPSDRAIKLSKLILEHCRYKHRVNELLSELRWHRDHLEPDIERAFKGFARALQKNEDPARQMIGTQILSVFAPLKEGETRFYPEVKRLQSLSHNPKARAQ